MKYVVIRKKEMANFLDALIGKYQVFAPVKGDNLVIFREIHSGNKALLDFANSQVPPKGVFFPQSERIFGFSLASAEAGIKEPPATEKRVILGMRPCDARSLLILDNIFNGELYKNTSYVDKREKTVVITLGCNQPDSTCFCTSLGGSPFAKDGSDLLLVDLGEEYIAQAVTDKGRQFLEEQKTYFTEATEASIKKMDGIMQPTEASVKPEVSIDGLKEKLDNLFSNPVWGTLSEKCLGCAVCTYLCPTCHCFDITDEVTRQTGERVRTWDSCMFPQFTQEASGANPRPTGKERMRQRIMHKFSYFPDNCGVIACVGCGRCIKHCPVNLDVRELLNSISERQDVVERQ
jgi:ferredoxin